MMLKRIIMKWCMSSKLIYGAHMIFVTDTNKVVLRQLSYDRLLKLWIVTSAKEVTLFFVFLSSGLHRTSWPTFIRNLLRGVAWAKLEPVNLVADLCNIATNGFFPCFGEGVHSTEYTSRCICYISSHSQMHVLLSFTTLWLLWYFWKSIKSLVGPMPALM